MKENLRPQGLKFVFVQMSMTILASASIGASLMLIGCESRVMEQSPTSVNSSGWTLEERIVAKDKLDARIQQIQQSANQAKLIINTFRKAQSANQNGDSYTPIDFLLDINAAISTKIPQHPKTAAPGVAVRTSTIQVPIKGLSEECKTIDAQMTSIVAPSPTETQIPDSGVTYAVRTCASKGEFVPVVMASWSNSTLSFGFNNKNLAMLFRDLLNSQLTSNGSCSFQMNDHNILQSVDCQNIQVNLSASEMSIIKDMQFNNSGDLRFLIVADLYNKDELAPKGTTRISVDGNGHPNIELRSIDHKTNDTPTAQNPDPNMPASVPAPISEPATPKAIPPENLTPVVNSQL